ncbi:MAG: TIGR03560 family F420-dependent LLM class oxidoreductase [Deltaproteobacteria bacterium]|nr:TIGR03560 family F420-dependent LLM class oxidoreductase [Deltaproteobacteria bacterium]
MLHFGTFAPQGWRLELREIDGAAAQWTTLRRTAQALERLGYDSLWVYDHFHTTPRPQIAPTFECWTTLAALAEATRTIRLGQLVTCAQYRNPAYLAKVAACVDVISGGRLEVGLGAGWKQDEFDAYGYGFGTIGGRLRRMADTARILKAMWTEPRATVAGHEWSVTDAINEPKPLQRPHPPLWIGAAGERVALRMVAELADGWNYNRGPEGFAAKLAILHDHCRAVGRDPATLRLSVERHCAIFDSAAERQAYIDRWWPGAEPERINAFLDSACVGTTAQVTAQLRFFIERGAELVILWFQDLATVGGGDSMAERFMTRVAPALRALR